MKRGNSRKLVSVPTDFEPYGETVPVKVRLTDEFVAMISRPEPFLAYRVKGRTPELTSGCILALPQDRRGKLFIKMPSGWVQLSEHLVMRQ